MQPSRRTYAVGVRAGTTPQPVRSRRRRVGISVGRRRAGFPIRAQRRVSRLGCRHDWCKSTATTSKQCGARRPAGWKQRAAAGNPRGPGQRASARASLDRALASGAVAESDIALTLHARRLISPTMRRQLAHTLRGIVEISRRPPLPPARWPSAQVAQAGSELLALAERLERPEAVDARGVALVRVLLGDGGGPLHVNRDAHGLVQAARAAAAALEPESGERSPRDGP